MIGGVVRERTEVKCDRIVAPVFAPVVFLCSLPHNGGQPIRKRLLEPG